MSAKDFIEKLFGEMLQLFKDEDELRKLWGVPGTRKRLLEELSERGYGEEPLTANGNLIDAEKSDLFDVLAYMAFALPTITREERVTSRHHVIVAGYDESL